MYYIFQDSFLQKNDKSKNEEIKENLNNMKNSSMFIFLDLHVYITVVIYIFEYNLTVFEKSVFLKRLHF